MLGFPHVINRNMLQKNNKYKIYNNKVKYMDDNFFKSEKWFTKEKKYKVKHYI